MGRCRSAQSLLVIAILLLAIRAFAGTRQSSAAAVLQLSVIELLISGLVLSAFQLHARFVIHINPNPPLVVPRKPVAVDVNAGGTSAVETASAQVIDLQPQAVLMTESSDPPSSGETEISVAEQPRIEHEAVACAAAEVASPNAAQPQGNGKNGKKQKFRKAG